MYFSIQRYTLHNLFKYVTAFIGLENIRNFMEPHLWRLHPDIDKNSGKLLRASKYTFHAVLAENFKFNNCFLIGDAAHQTPPFLGQGLCQGIKDAYNLCWKLSGVIEKKYDKKILESFSTERKEINNFMIKASVEQAKIVGSLDKFKAFRRDVFLTLARIFPKLQGVLTFQYKWQFKNGILDKDLYPNDLNGMIIPHPDLTIKKDTGPSTVIVKHMMKKNKNTISSNIQQHSTYI